MASDVARGATPSRLRAATAAFATNWRNPELRRAQAAFFGAWTAEWAVTVVLAVYAYGRGRRHGGGRGGAGARAARGRRGTPGHAVRRPVAARAGARGGLRGAGRHHRPGRLGGVRRRSRGDRVCTGHGVVRRGRALPAGALGAPAVAVRHPARARRRQCRSRSAGLGGDAGRPRDQRGAAGDGRDGAGARGGGRRVGLGRLADGPGAPRADAARPRATRRREPAGPRPRWGASGARQPRPAPAHRHDRRPDLHARGRHGLHRGRRRRARGSRRPRGRGAQRRTRRRRGPRLRRRRPPRGHEAAGGLVRARCGPVGRTAGRHRPAPVGTDGDGHAGRRGSRQRPHRRRWLHPDRAHLPRRRARPGLRCARERGRPLRRSGGAAHSRRHRRPRPAQQPGRARLAPARGGGALVAPAERPGCRDRRPRRRAGAPAPRPPARRPAPARPGVGGTSARPRRRAGRRDGLPAGRRR